MTAPGEGTATDRFWSRIATGVLPYQRCPACGAVDFPPLSSCRSCGRPVDHWEESAGVGTVTTWTGIERTGDPAFRPLLPYAVAIVTLDEGFSMIARVDPIDAVEIGARCRLRFETSPATGRPVPHFEIAP